MGDRQVDAVIGKLLHQFPKSIYHTSQIAVSVVCVACPISIVSIFFIAVWVDFFDQLVILVINIAGSQVNTVLSIKIYVLLYLLS